MWKYQHQQAHDRYKAGHKAWALNPGHTWRLASEFEAAVVQRGLEASLAFMMKELEKVKA